MASDTERKIAIYQELERRGELGRLPPEKQAVWQELKARGAVGQSQQSPAPSEDGIVAKAFKSSPVTVGGDIALSLGSNMVGQIAGGLAGIPAALLDSPAAGAAVSEGVAERLTYSPRTEGGQTAMGSLAPVGKALEKVQDVTGEGAVEVGRGVGIDPSSETAATLYAAGSAVPDAVGMLLGAKAPKLRSKPGRPNAAIESIEELTAPKDSASPAALTNQADTLEQAMPRQPEAVPVKESAKKAEIRQAIQNGDKAGAQYVIDNRGQIVTDKAAKRVISQGFSDGAVATIKNSSKADRARMLKMLNVAERGLKNPTHRARFRPSDVIGDSIMERWNVVSTANKKARTEITAAAQKELAGKQVDISDAVDSFADALDELGVQVGDDGLTFKGSQIEGSDIAPIKRVFDRLNAQGDGLSLHRLKQYIDSQIDWDKPTKQKPLDQKAVNALKDLRRNINEKLKAESGAYADANARAAETFGVMGDMMDVMGRRFDPHGENASVYAGQEMRKILSNYGKRADMIQAMDKLDEVAGKYGGKFTDDPINQVVFYSDMERLFGSFADNSLQGVMQKGVGKAIDATVGGQSKTAMIAEGMKAAFDKASGVNEQGAIRAMRELLQRQ